MRLNWGFYALCIVMDTRGRGRDSRTKDITRDFDIDGFFDVRKNHQRRPFQEGDGMNERGRLCARG